VRRVRAARELSQAYNALQALIGEGVKYKKGQKIGKDKKKILAESCGIAAPGSRHTRKAIITLHIFLYAFLQAQNCIFSSCPVRVLTARKACEESVFSRYQYASRT
jgi:hypothetical protein